MSVNAETIAATAGRSAAREHARPVMIEARGIEKTFRVPEQRIDSFKERAIHPFTRLNHRELRVLRGISFDVHQGEFFGIVGRNGSGKSSLLKILASIYRADAGRVRIAGRVAPFIELGVGFNPELTARENVVLNGVMMGLSRREARRRLDEVLDFADLSDFAELKLKNYSSGMMVRLAFAVMVQADADVMLIDEVLAVGDAAFAQKCMDVFHEKRRSGKTIVLVTHDMATVQGMCHRAMLIHDGELRYIGEPEQAAMEYYRLNFGGLELGSGEARPGGVPDVNARVIHAALENDAGERVENVEQGQPILLNIEIEARQELAGPMFGVQFLHEDGAVVFGFNRTLTLAEGQDDRLDAGQRVRISGRIENPLLPGRYVVIFGVCRNRNQGDVALQLLRLFDFVVYGTRPGIGVVSVRADVEAVAKPGPIS
jgi:ABC-2 type transport system ATP-binding protein